MLRHTKKIIIIFKLIFFILCFIMTLFLSSKPVKGAELKSINNISNDSYIDLTDQQGLVLYPKSSSGILVSSSNGTIYNNNERRFKWTRNLVVL